MSIFGKQISHKLTTTNAPTFTEGYNQTNINIAKLNCVLSLFTQLHVTVYLWINSISTASSWCSVVTQYGPSHGDLGKSNDDHWKERHQNKKCTETNASPYEWLGKYWFNFYAMYLKFESNPDLEITSAVF